MVLKTVVESLDELILLSRESLKRRDTFFESVRHLVRRAEVSISEIDAWWFQMNRALSYMEELRLERQMTHAAGEVRVSDLQSPPSRSARRQEARATRAAPWALIEETVSAFEQQAELAEEAARKRTAAPEPTAPPSPPSPTTARPWSSLPQMTFAPGALQAPPSVSLDGEQELRPLKGRQGLYRPSLAPPPYQPAAQTSPPPPPPRPKP